jgi:adenylosuccinate synthase
MPVSVVVGGQYGSEGKGKVAHHIARGQSAAAVIRVGGPNSGHTSIAPDGEREVLQQLPIGALLDGLRCLIGPGSYIEPEILLAEVDRLGLDESRLCIDYRAFVIGEADRIAEREAGLGERIGSTGSGTGAAAARRIGRHASESLAYRCDRLRPFVGDAVAAAREFVSRAVSLEGLSISREVSGELGVSSP